MSVVKGEAGTRILIVRSAVEVVIVRVHRVQEILRAEPVGRIAMAG
jgi:hypothetical protein